MTEKIAITINDIDLTQNRENKIKFRCKSCGNIHEFRIRYFKEGGDLICRGCHIKSIYKSKYNIQKLYINKYDDLTDLDICLTSQISFKCNKCNEIHTKKLRDLLNRKNKTKYILCNDCHRSYQVGLKNSMNTKEGGWKCIGCKTKFNTRREWQLHTKQCDLRKKQLRKEKIEQPRN